MVRIGLVVVLRCLVTSARVVDVVVDIDKAVQDINDSMFVGVTLDTALIQNKWEGLDFGSEKVQTLARGLSPCFLRVGGIAGDALTFDPTNRSPSLFTKKNPHQRFVSNFTMSAHDWDVLNTFSSDTGMALIFGLNALKRNGSEWDATDAIELLQYTQQRGYKLTGIELGNEPDDFLGRFDVYVDPDQMGADALAFHELLRNMSYYNTTRVIGPDVAKPFIYLDEYLDVDGGIAVDVVSFHQLGIVGLDLQIATYLTNKTFCYYFSPEVADTVMFTEPYYFDQCIKKIVDALDMATYHVKGKPVWLGETSTTSGTGSPNISNTYVAGFMWLDKLGVSAKYGLKAVLRQDLYGSYNSLIQQNTFDPNPDYWLTLLFKRLVGSPVLNLTTTGDNSVRVYVHCARQNSVYKYGPGSIVVYAINLDVDNVTLSMPQFRDKQLDVFLLTPQANNLQATIVELNGCPLHLDNNTFPPLSPVRRSSHWTLPSNTMGFLVIPDAHVSLCV